MSMAYRYHSRRAVKKLAKKSQRNFIITLIIIIVLIYTTITWVLPSFVGGIGFVKNITNPSQKTATKSFENAEGAPPVLNIPYESTSSSIIEIRGYGTPDTKVKLYIDDSEIQTIEVTDDGSFIFENVTLSLGTNNIFGTTVDEKDKESLPSKSLQLIFDNEKPSLDIYEPEDNKKIEGGDKKVKVSGKTEPGIKVFVNDTQLILNSDGSFNMDQSLNDGENILTIKAVDGASNTTQIQRLVNYAPPPSPSPSPQPSPS